MSGFKLKGALSKGQRKQVTEAPPELKDVQPQQEDFLSAKPAVLTTAIKKMFSKPAPAIEKSTAPIVKTRGIEVTKTEAVVPNQVPLSQENNIKNISNFKVNSEQGRADYEEFLKNKKKKKVIVAKEKEKETTVQEYSKEDYTEALERLSSLILEEEKGDHYEKEAAVAYVPDTRRGFSEFIKEEYSAYMLKPVGEQMPTPEGEKYPYQKFIREYIRNASPYRGILVYHGLGSGKTCSAIAASEALFATSNKKIIVMTPFSLRKNFLKEITFCGFRHFRLQNYWITLDKENPAHMLFATNVLNISENHLKTAKHIWVPDFDQAESNYNSLSGDEQTEIRKQILSILVYDKKKNPTGRIHFINYNGISATRLKELACKESNYFDNSVIVIDEIHNIIRLMTGKIEPYLTSIGKKRRIVQETIGAEKWKPSLCLTARNYRRGYMFYRLLLSVTNSKIIGLSGTPLINFPEELGILANILHGYTPVIRGVVSVGGEALEEIQDILYNYQYCDFVRVEPDTHGTRFLISLLPDGIRKISNDVGVERIPEGIAIPSKQEILEEIKGLFGKYKFSMDPILNAYPLLPLGNEQFNTNFIKEPSNDDNPMNNSIIKNKLVLVKRLTGIISYYKGSNEDLMPKVIRDVVVRVPMSTYQQEKYTIVRANEAKKELQDSQKKSKDPKDPIWAEVFDITKQNASNNYRMGSRQICNFVFPPEVKRPTPSSKGDFKFETKGDKEIADSIPDTSNINDEDFPELEEDADELNEEQVNAEENAVVKEEDGLLEDGMLEDGKDGEDGENGEDAKDAKDEVLATNTVVPPVKKLFSGKSAKQILLQQKEQRLIDCKSGRKPGEDYAIAISRSKKCLVEFAYEKLRLDNPQGLTVLSSKYAAMLQNIQNTPGSSLIYSQFLDMEGIGIFRIVIDANGYAPIEIISDDTGGYSFSTKTEESLRKGSIQPRYITFSGAEKEDVRRLALDVFNARFNELPESLSSVLLESGFKNNDNKKGQICRCFCITSAGAEGLSLKNVRAVHIMEPYWNDVRLKQVKGRAIRIGSHLDLPKEDRNVSIYTYISIYSNEAQKETSGPNKIDESIVIADSLTRKEAIEYNIPIGDLNEYTPTSDEFLYIVSQKKKTIIDELENVMKSSAVDCELNYKENKDGTFRCLPLKGKVGDFLYHPDIDTDIRESASQLEIEVKKVQKKVIKFSYKNKNYAAEDNGENYLVYLQDDLESPIGTMIKKDNKPSLPITFS